MKRARATTDTDAERPEVEAAGTDNDVAVVGDPGRLAAALSPMRRRLLDALATPDSASGLARRLELPRQKVNYHLRELEKRGFVELAEERQRRGFTERVLRVTARSFVIDPSMLPTASAEAADTGDRFSSAWLLSTAARVVRDVARLRDRARAVRKPLPAFTLSTEVTFASPDDFRAFGDEVTDAVTKIAAKHARKAAKAKRGGREGRLFRAVLALHPTITKTEEEARREASDAQARTSGGTAEKPRKPRRGGSR